MTRILRISSLFLGVAFGLGATPESDAAPLNGSDLILTDPTPGVAFDDSDTVGWDWIIQGRVEYFRVYDEANDRIYLKFNPSDSSVSLGRDATSGGSFSTALGYAASSGGINSTALGRDASSTGNSSTAVGHNSATTGLGSTALGYFSSAVGDNSTALGRSASSGGTESIALGREASSAGFGGIALGSEASSAGSLSTALGAEASSDDGASTALGSLASSEGDGSIALGQSATSAGGLSTALGLGASSVGISSVALGSNASSVGNDSVAIGTRASAPSPNTIVLGQIPSVNGGFNYTEVANGTTDPQAPLHLFRDDATQELLWLESGETGVNQDRAMMYLANNGGIRFEFANYFQGNAWRFQAATGNDDRFEITKVGTGDIEMAVDALGNMELRGDLEVGGTVTEMSDRDAKQNIESLSGEEVLKRLSLLPVSEWSYKQHPEARHAGPMAQDFHAAFGLGQDDRRISARDMAGINMAAVKALARENQQLKASNQTLRNDLDTLKAMVMQLLPQTVHK